MGWLSDKLTGRFGSHVFEVRAENHLLSGLVYKLFLDETELVEAQNFFKVPTRRTLEARVALDGKERAVVLEVTQKMLRTDLELKVDGEKVPLTHVE